MSDDWYMPHIPMDAVAREEERRRQAAQAAFIESLKRTTWEWTLVHNVAIAGALTKSFALGRCYSDDLWDVEQHGKLWRPGCGRSAP